MKLVDLFSGIGGFSLAAHWMGWETKVFVEKDEFCRKVLTKNFPGVPIYGDIHTFRGERESADIVCGGFPCQPYSLAGKRKGTDDERHLWPEMLRVVREIQPRFVVAENVLGIVTWSRGVVFENVQADLEDAGYEVWAGVVPACAIGAQSRRDRVWFVGQLPDPSGIRCVQCEGTKERLKPTSRRTPQRFVDPLYRDASRYYRRNESVFSGVVNGLPDRVDRIRSLGNSIVPQIAYEIFRAIEKSMTSEGKAATP